MAKVKTDDHICSTAFNRYTLIGKWQKGITPVHWQWNYVFLALIHQIVFHFMVIRPYFSWDMVNLIFDLFKVTAMAKVKIGVHIWGNLAINPYICFSLRGNQTTSIVGRVSIHDDIIKWKHFPRYWRFVRGIHRWPVNSPHKGQWCWALMFFVMCVWINSWVNNHEAGDFRCHHAHYDVTVMRKSMLLVKLQKRRVAMYLILWPMTTINMHMKFELYLHSRNHATCRVQKQKKNKTIWPPGGHFENDVAENQ